MVVFGREPRVEVPPAPSELNLLGIETTIDPENTDLAAAVKLALASFPDDTARRIVVLSDGNENRGNLFEQAPDRQVAGRAGRRLAARVLLRPRGAGRKGLDSPRRQEGRDGQHQRRDSRQRADPRDAPGFPESRQLPGSGRRQRATVARSSCNAASTYSHSGSSSPNRIFTHSRRNSFPRREAATAARSTISPRASPMRGARPRCS